MTGREFFSLLAPTYIENWNPALYPLSIPQVGFSLSLEEARAMGRKCYKFGKWFSGGPSASLHRVVHQIDGALRQFPEGAFIRLGSRSAKDSHFALSRGLRVIDAQDAVKMLTGASRRVASDLILALRKGYRPHIYLRQWLEIPAWAEFRCFMKDRKLIGISQYYRECVGHSPEIVEREGPIRAAIEAFFERFRLASHLDNVVFDVFLHLEPAGCGSRVTVKLLELNPFFLETDPCLFDWADERGFDGSFRFL